jgi:hypothetical protein
VAKISALNNANEMVKKLENIEILNSQGLITGVFYDVPAYFQGQTNLCWAFAQVMSEVYQTGNIITQSEAEKQAARIAQGVYGNNNYNKPGSPTNSSNTWFYGVGHHSYVNGFDDLSNAISSGPVYGFYSNAISDIHAFLGFGEGHFVVVTGTLSAPGHENLVTSNNPWEYGSSGKGSQNIQTYNDFISGIPDDDNRMIFKGIYKVNK